MKKKAIRGNIDLINKIIFVVNVALLIVLFFAYRYVFEVESTKRIYAEETEKLMEETKNPVFKIDKIVLYNSANVEDKSDGNLSNLDISQFTDIQILLNNKSKSEEITAENTISQLFISNIKIETESTEGEKIFNYKNPLNCGKYVDLENYRDDGIVFNIVNSNEKNKSANYDENIFYTDCSNPISLGYVNKNILKNGMINTNNASLAFDGSILKDAGIDIEKLNATISFTIHIINNYNEEYICNVQLKNDLTAEEGIASGYLMNIINPKSNELNFIKVSD